MTEENQNQDVDNQQDTQDQVADQQNNNADSDNNATDDFSLLGDDNADTKDAVKFEDGVKPEGLPDELWDEEGKTVKVEDMYAKLQQAEERVKGLRGKLSKGEGRAPKDVEGYKLDLSEEESEKLADVITDDDPVIAKLKDVCFENKISNEVYNNIVKEVAGFLQENAAGIAAGEHLTDEQRAAIKEQEYKKIGANAPAVVRAVTEWTRALHQQGQLSEDDVQAIKAFGSTGDGVRVLNIMRQMSGQQEIPMEAKINDGLPSDKEIFDMMASEKYMSGDAATHEKVNTLLAQRKQAGRPDLLQVSG